MDLQLAGMLGFSFVVVALAGTAVLLFVRSIIERRRYSSQELPSLDIMGMPDEGDSYELPEYEPDDLVADPFDMRGEDEELSDKDADAILRPAGASSGRRKKR